MDTKVNEKIKGIPKRLNEAFRLRAFICHLFNISSNFLYVIDNITD